jgi:hypothetical protein
MWIRGHSRLRWTRDGSQDRDAVSGLEDKHNKIKDKVHKMELEMS